MAGDLYEGARRIRCEQEAWPLGRVIRFMQQNGERVDLWWNTETNQWQCLWSTERNTYYGRGKEPHNAAIAALLKGQS